MMKIRNALPCAKKEWAHLAAILFVGCMLMVTACFGGPSPSSGESDQPLHSTEPTSFEPSRDNIKTVRMGYTLFTDNSRHAQAIEDAVNHLLEEQGTPLRLKFEIICSETEDRDIKYFHDVTIRSNASDSFDIFPSYWWWDDYDELAQGGFVFDLTELLPQFPNLFSLNAREVWEEAAIKGRNYWVPLENRLVGSDMTFDLQVDQSVLNYLSVDFPRTLEEMLAIQRGAREKNLPYKLLCSEVIPTRALHKTYEEWPFFVDEDSLFVFYGDGRMEPYIESEIFLKDAALLQKLAAEGLIEWFRLGSSYQQNIEGRNVAMIAHGGDSMTHMPLERGKPNIRIGRLAQGAFFLTKNCMDPVASLAMIEAIYTNEKIALTLVYGIEGTDWAIQDDGTITMINESFQKRYQFEHDKVMLPYQSVERIEELDAHVTQGYPFSEFLFYDDVYKNDGYLVPPLAGPLMDAINQMYDLRKGDLPMTELATVKENLYTNGFGELYEQEQQRYQEFLAR